MYANCNNYIQIEYIYTTLLYKKIKLFALCIYSILEKESDTFTSVYTVQHFGNRIKYFAICLYSILEKSFEMVSNGICGICLMSVVHNVVTCQVDQGTGQRTLKHQVQ
jgi:hypothetical protein